jgi:5-methylcytosine-specific restriction endonuclease McrA
MGQKKRKAIPRYIKDELLLKQNNSCALCYEKFKTTYDNINFYQVDHIIPHCETEDDSIENLQILCSYCHTIKTVREIRARRKVISVNECKQRKKELKNDENDLNINPFKHFAFSSKQN